MDTFIVELTAMAHGGSALGRIGSKTVFIPYTLPGERVEARIVDDHGRWAIAELVRVLNPSPDRVLPTCPHFGPSSGDDPPGVPARGCGGCQWQHIAYPAQLRLKQAIVRDQLARIGKLPDVDVRPTLGMAEPWGYRNHVQLRPSEAGSLGFRALREHTVIPIEVCYIMAPGVESLWRSLDLDFPALRQVVLRADMGTDDSLILLETSYDTLPDLEVDFSVSINLELRAGAVINLVGSPWLTAHVAGRDFRVSAEAFFQVNTTMAEIQVRLVREALEPFAGQTLLDLYAGVGLFGLALADEVGRVIAVEAGQAAVADWRVNAAGLDHCTMVEGPVEDVLPGLGERVDLAVVDPPRAGMEPLALDALVAAAPRRIAYVSCDPATLARDAQRLARQGYRLRYVQPIDLFPQTWHIECVALLTRDERGTSVKPPAHGPEGQGQGAGMDHGRRTTDDRVRSLPKGRPATDKSKGKPRRR